MSDPTLERLAQKVMLACYHAFESLRSGLSVFHNYVDWKFEVQDPLTKETKQERSLLFWGGSQKEKLQRKEGIPAEKG